MVSGASLKYGAHFSSFAGKKQKFINELNFACLSGAARNFFLIHRRYLCSLFFVFLMHILFLECSSSKTNYRWFRSFSSKWNLRLTAYELKKKFEIFKLEGKIYIMK